MRRLFTIALCVFAFGALLAPQSIFAQDEEPPPDVPDAPEMPSEGMLKWQFDQGMTLHFTFNTHHASITSMKGTTEGAVLRLVAALGQAEDEEIANQAAELLKKGGQPVLEVLEEYITHEAKRHERRKLAPIVEYLREHPEAEEEMPDRFIVAEREGRTNCAIDQAVERVRGRRTTIHVKTRHIALRAKQRTLGMQDYEHATFQTGQKVLDPASGQYVEATEPDNPIAKMFYSAMDLDYTFTIDLDKRDVTKFNYAAPLAEQERIQFGLDDPLQVGPSFRRLPGKVTKVGEKWEVVFEYFAGGGNTRIHICEYTLEEIALRQQRRCARMPWIERIYHRAAREPFPGKLIGGGKGEFWIDIDNHCLVFHSQEIAFESRTTLEIPKKDAPDETRAMETYFNNVLKIEMRLNRITREQTDDNR